jgi:hypothetical protein
MAKVIIQEDVWELADTLYWEVVTKLNIVDECVVDDPDNSEGTRNTEKGESLYYAIEDTIQAWFNMDMEVEFEPHQIKLNF